MNKKRLLSLLCAGTLLLPLGVFGEEEEDEEVSFADVSGMDLEIEVAYDDVEWNFPVDLQDMEPDKVILANKHMLLDKDFVSKPLVSIPTRKSNKDGSNANNGVLKASSGKMQLQEDCAAALVAMCEAAREEGLYLYLKSAYRSYQTQNTMYYNRLKKNNGKDDGWVSKPGASDHQTGLGCDVVPKSWRDKSMNSSMASTEECQWMAAHCAEYGFIIRYPEDKEDVTEINYEPWHLRYVGVAAATYIMENGLCLEEFHDQLQAAIDEFLAAGGNRSLVEDFIQVSAEN
jgi:zinc D-Ala-D-Ala carboxypeptidase